MHSQLTICFHSLSKLCQKVSSDPTEEETNIFTEPFSEDLFLFFRWVLLHNVNTNNSNNQYDPLNMKVAKVLTPFTSLRSPLTRESRKKLMLWSMLFNCTQTYKQRSLQALHVALRYFNNVLNIMFIFKICIWFTKNIRCMLERPW